MTGARTKHHKAVFEALSTRVAPTFQEHGFVRHPAYEDGWDPHNQEYTVDLVKSDFDRHINQLKFSYRPGDRTVRVEIIQSENAFAIQSLEDFPGDAGDWTDLWLYRPFTRFTLRSGNAWNPLSIKNVFKVKLKEGRDLEAELDRLAQAINKKVPYLLAAITGSDCGRHVDIVHQHITRPSD